MSILNYETLKKNIEDKLSYEIDIKDDQNLIALGLNSLQVMRLLNQCKKAGILISFKDLMQNPTLANWMSLIENKMSELTAEPTLLIDEEIVEQPFACVPIGVPFEMTDVQYAYWVGRNSDQALGNVGTHAYLEFDGSLVEPERIKTAWDKLLQHHPMLRARFTKDGMQEILPSPHPNSFEINDLRKLSEQDCENKLIETRERLSHRLLDIEHGQVAGLTLSLLSNQRSRIHFDLDLMVADVQSMKIILRDFLSAYLGKKLPEASATWNFNKYLQLEKVKKQTELSAAKAYWTQRLNTFPSAPALPMIKKPSELQQIRFTRRTHSYSTHDWNCIKKVASLSNSTPAMILLAIYATVIERWSESSHFTINIPLFNRSTEYDGIEDVVADFTTLILLEVDMRTPMSFFQLVSNLQSQIHSDMAYSAYSGVQFQRDLYKMLGEQQIIAPVVFACNLGSPLFETQLEAVLGKCTYMISQTPQIWIDFQIFEDEHGLKINWDTIDELFPPNMLNDMFDSLTSCLDILSQKDYEDLCTHDILPNRQKQARLSNLQVLPPAALHGIHEPFFEYAKSSPDKIAIIGEYDGDVLTYQELSLSALRIASTLVNNGIRESGIVISLPKGRKQVEAVYGVLASGNYYIPVDTDQPFERRELILQQTAARYVLTDRETSTHMRWPNYITCLIIDDTEAMCPLKRLTCTPKVAPIWCREKIW